MENYTDQTLTCRDCGAEFAFTAREQEFYAEKGLRNPPSRCKPCRDKRKAENPRGGGFGRGGGGGGRSNRPSFKVSCSACGAETTVPFEPVNGKPVYCRDCFQKFKQAR